MISLPREGFTIDFVGSIARNTILNPFVLIPLTASYYMLMPTYSTASTIFVTVIPMLTALTLYLRITDFLNKKYHNNWASDSTWDWEKEIVVITGGSGGIGAHLAQQLHRGRSNPTLVIVDCIPLTWTPLDRQRVFYYQCDLGSSSQLRDVCRRIREDVGHPTVLMNNAGISRGVTVCDGSYADVEATIRINLIAPFLLVKEFLPEMVRQNHGHIVNVSSMSAFFPPAKVADYAATKAGLKAFHEALQLELKNEHKADRVRLSIAFLSFTRTPLFKGETNQSNFWFPLLDVDSVSEEIARVLWSGYGKTIFMPGIMRYVVMMGLGPEWIWRLAREGTGRTRVDFKGRQRLDPKSGALL
ncbi:hypothetical protein V2G26_008050 [Clonostachys chloroleuca]|uniref:Uncharacterized protein n=1 Tax=Clonostachys chloroleuca TaxID=1926264 RepID=A0AA35M185_9HYPO|nr:unnamed protein product [Clonostachys chloroleuca]